MDPWVAPPEESPGNAYNPRREAADPAVRVSPPERERRDRGDGRGRGVRFRRGKPYSVQPWIGEARSLQDISGQSLPRPQEWLRDLHRQRLFDVLIANTDRNSGNIVVDPDWNMVLVDHSRSLSDTRKVTGIEKLARIDRPFFDRVKSLEYETFWEKVGPWLQDIRCASALMARRDRVVKHFEALAAEKGDLVVFSR